MLLIQFGTVWPQLWHVHGVACLLHENSSGVASASHSSVTNIKNWDPPKFQTFLQNVLLMTSADIWFEKMGYFNILSMSWKWHSHIETLGNCSSQNDLPVDSFYKIQPHRTNLFSVTCYENQNHFQNQILHSRNWLFKPIMVSGSNKC